VLVQNRTQECDFATFQGQRIKFVKEKKGS